MGEADTDADAETALSDAPALDGETAITVETLNSGISEVLDATDALYFDYVVGDVGDCREATGNVPREHVWSPAGEETPRRKHTNRRSTRIATASTSPPSPPPSLERTCFALTLVSWWLQGRGRFAHRVVAPSTPIPATIGSAGYVAERPRAGRGLAWFE